MDDGLWVIFCKPQLERLIYVLILVVMDDVLWVELTLCKGERFFLSMLLVAVDDVSKVYLVDEEDYPRPLVACGWWSLVKTGRGTS
jgi:hypothetical protein